MTKLNASSGRWSASMARRAAWVVVVVTAVGTLAGCLPAPSRRVGVFNGSISQAKITTFGTWLGRTPKVAIDYLPDEAWADPTPWLHPWKGSPWKMSFGVPMLPPGGVLTDGAAGVHDAHFRQLAEELILEGLDRAVLRIGVEFNGDWFRWRAAADPSAFVAFWRRIVLVMRSVPGAHFKFDWTVLAGRYEIPGAYVYPGDAFVDFIGVNVYDNSFYPGTYPIPAGATAQETASRRQQVWFLKTYGADGLNYWAQFAASHNKYLSLPEWAVVDSTHRGGGDNVYFIERMHNWVTHNNVAYQAYFNGSGGLGDTRLTGATAFPAAAAFYQQLFR